MKKPFTARRVARKVGVASDDDEQDQTSKDSVVKRPGQIKGKQGKASRLSFQHSESTQSAKKASLARATFDRSTPQSEIPFRAGAERPSYSIDDLRVLQDSTPITTTLDVEAKFGALTTTHVNSSVIPTDAEIREKKERRARLAKEQEYISLHGEGSDDEGPRDVILRTGNKYGETRLVREDEDMAEGFDDFVEDERLALGKKSRVKQKRDKRNEMESMIIEAQANSETDDSEVERNEAYDNAQTKAGTYGQKSKNPARPRTPPKITPIQDLNSILNELKQNRESLRPSLQAKAQRLVDIKLEKEQNVAQEAYIQSQLKELGEKYEKLRTEAGSNGLSMGQVGENGNVVLHSGRGLENLSARPIPENSSDESDEDDDDNEVDADDDDEL